MITKPDMQSQGGVYRLSWPDLNIEAMVERLQTDGRQSVSGEVTIWNKSPGQPELLEKTVLNLSSNVTRNQLAKALSNRVEEIDWESIVKYVCVLTIEDYRKGEPVLEIGRKPQSMQLAYQLYPILEKGEATMLFGPGGSAKSYLADYIAVLVHLNYSGVHQWLPQAGNVLYLDWETSSSVHERRIWAIKQGLGINSEETIFYRFCTQPLAADIVEIQRLVLNRGIAMVIVDSQVAASGVDPDKAETVSAYFNALRSLRCTTLTIDHVPKNQESPKGMPFGSVFKWNRARSLFEVKQSQEPGEGELEIGLYHRKHNEGKLLKPIGIRIKFTENEDGELFKVTFSEADIREVPELAKSLPIKDRIVGLLKSGPMGTKAIAEELNENQQSVKAILNRGKGKLFTKLDNGDWGLFSQMGNIFSNNVTA